RNDLAGLAAMLKSGIRIGMHQTLMVVMPVSLVVAWFMPDLVGISAPLRGELRWGAIFGMLGFLLSPLEAFRSMLACRQLGYLVDVALTAMSLAFSILAVWLAWLGWRLPGQYVAQMAGQAVFAILAMIFVARHLSGHLRTRGAEIDEKELWSLRWPMLL